MVHRHHPGSAPAQGWLYAALILDAFNREVISWAVDDYDTPRTRDARHGRGNWPIPCPTRVVSSTPTAATSSPLSGLAQPGLALTASTISIGERKTALDNAAMESWFASLKNEEIYPNGTPGHPRRSPSPYSSRYIWTYNTKRLHSTLGYLSPKTYAQTASTCP